MTSIGDYAFTSTGLTSFEIPATVTSIGYVAFGYCNNLTSITIPATVTSISASVFNGCDNLANIYVPAKNVASYKSAWSDFGYKDKISVVFDGTSLETLSFPDNVTVNGVKYDRTFTVGKPSTVMLPFSKSVSDISGGTFFTFGGVQKEYDTWVATMNQVTGTIEANTPYLFVPTGHSLTFTGGATLNTTGGVGKETAEAGSHWTFKGTYDYKEWIADGANADEIGRAYGFAGVAKDGINVGDFVKVKSGAKIRPMSAYLLWNDTPNLAPARRMNRGAAADDELPQSITVRQFNANGEVTSIGTLDTTTGEVSFDGWYDMSGRRLDGKPTTKGLYINNGKKIIIK